MENSKGIKTPPSEKVVGQNMFFPQEEIHAVKESVLSRSDHKDEMDMNAKTAMNFNKKKVSRDSDEIG